MADGVNVTPGNGVIVAADEIASQQYQRVKMVLGADGVNDGDVNILNPLPIINAAPQPNATGSITAAAQVVKISSLTGIGSATVLVSGTFSAANLIFEVSNNAGTTFTAIPAQLISTGAVSTTTGSITNATLLFNVSPLLGVDQLQVRCTAITSGSVSIVIHPSTQFVQYQANVNATQAGNYTVLPGNTANTTPWLVRENNPATPTRTSVASSTTSATLLAANTSRRSVMFFNESTASLYLGIGASASLTSYTIKMAPNAYYELPNPVTTAIITGLWDAANGSLRITEIV